MISATLACVSQPMPAVAAPTIATSPERLLIAIPAKTGSGSIYVGRRVACEDIDKFDPDPVFTFSSRTKQRNRDCPEPAGSNTTSTAHPDGERFERRVDDVRHQAHAVDVDHRHRVRHRVLKYASPDCRTIVHVWISPRP